MTTCIKFTGTDIAEKNRKLYYTTFSKFGDIRKIFIERNSEWGCIYFKDTHKILEYVKQLNAEKPFNYNYTVHLTESKNLNYQAENGCDMESINSEDKEEILANENPMLYCFHGHEIPQFADEQGNSYVPLSNLKCLYVKLFNRPPPLMDKLQYNSELVKEFEIFMKQMAIKFMYRNKILFDKEYIQNTITVCKDLVFATSGNVATSTPQQNYTRSSSIKEENSNNGFKLNKSRLTNYQRSQSPKYDNSVNKPSRFSFQETKPSHYNTDNKFQKSKITNSTKGESSFKGRDFYMNDAKEHSINVVKESSINEKENSKDEGKEAINVLNTSSINQTETILNNSLRKPRSPSNLVDIQYENKIKYIEPKLGVEQEVLITHVEENKSYYVQLNERRVEIDNLLFTTVQSAGKALPVQPIVGEMVFALYLGTWYRAVILSTTPAVKVKYIDYGNVSTEPIKEVRQITKELAQIPAEAIEVHFSTKVNIPIKDEIVLKVKFIEKTDNGRYIVKHITDERVSEKKRGSRLCVIDTPARNAVVSIMEIIDNTSFIAFIFHENCIEDVNSLDFMSEECSVDCNYSPKVGETIAVEKEPNTWVRGVVMSADKSRKYKCALIDYGTIIQTSNICRLNAKYEDLLVCICVVNVPTSSINDFKEEKITCDILKEKKIIIRIKDKELPAVGKAWNPFQRTVINVLPPKIDLKVGDVVKIVNVDERRIYFRTKDSFALLKNLNEKLRLHQCTPLLSSPEKNSLVLHKCDNILRRAIVKNVKQNIVDLYYFDYSVKTSAPLEELHKYEEDFQNFACTLTEFDLDHFQLQKYNSEVVKELKKLEKQKFKVIAQNGGIDFQFETSNTLLSHHLKSLLDKEKPIMVNDLPLHNIKKGTYQLMCLCSSDLNKGLVAFCAPNLDPNLVNQLTNDIAKFTATAHKPYTPQLNEICLGLFEGAWYRAIVLNASGDEYEVYYLDFGNFLTLTAKDLRPINKELITIPPVAILCEIQELKEITSKNSKVLGEVKNICQEEKLIEIEVISNREYYKYLISLNMESDESEEF